MSVLLNMGESDLYPKLDRPLDYRESFIRRHQRLLIFLAILLAIILLLPQLIGPLDPSTHFGGGCKPAGTQYIETEHVVAVIHDNQFVWVLAIHEQVANITYGMHTLTLNHTSAQSVSKLTLAGEWQWSIVMPMMTGYNEPRIFLLSNGSIALHGTAKSGTMYYYRSDGHTFDMKHITINRATASPTGSIVNYLVSITAGGSPSELLIDDALSMNQIFQGGKDTLFLVSLPKSVNGSSIDFRHSIVQVNQDFQLTTWWFTSNQSPYIAINNKNHLLASRTVDNQLIIDAYDAGVLLWQQSYSGSIRIESTTVFNGSLAIYGSFYDTATFDTAYTAISTDAFIIMLGDDGSLQRTTILSGNGEEMPMSMLMDSSMIYLVGRTTSQTWSSEPQTYVQDYYIVTVNQSSVTKTYFLNYDYNSYGQEDLTFVISDGWLDLISDFYNFTGASHTLSIHQFSTAGIEQASYYPNITHEGFATSSDGMFLGYAQTIRLTNQSNPIVHLQLQQLGQQLAMQWEYTFGGMGEYQTLMICYD